MKELHLMTNMIRHSRRSQSSRSRSRYRSSSSLTWVWILVGILIGIASAVGTYTFFNRAVEKQHSQAKSSNPSHLHPKTLAENSKKSSKQEKNNAQRFEFYTLLPGMEIQLPDKNLPNHSLKQKTLTPPQPLNAANQNNAAITSVQRPQPEIAEQTTHQAKQQAKLTATSQNFIIQAGIFKGLTEADELKAKLTLQGFNTRIQKIKTDEGQTWFRVTLGPFTTEDQALKQKQHLQDQKIQGILILQRPST